MNAIQPISEGDTDALDKVNRVIDKANGVDAQIAAEALARNAALRALPLSSPVLHRPGDAPDAFGLSLSSGEPVGIDPVAPSLLRYGDAGRIVRLIGAGIVAPRQMYPVEPGRRYLASFAVQRRVNTNDPDGDAIRLAVAWYGQSKSRLSSPQQTVVADLTGVTTGIGRQLRQAVISRMAGDGVDIVAPAGARYARPYVETFGVLPQDDVEIVGWLDITDVVSHSPDVAAVVSRVAALEGQDLGDRLTAVEAEITAPRVMRVRTFADAIAAAGTVPVSVDVIETLGYYDPSGAGGARYARVSADPGHAASFASWDGDFFVLLGDLTDLRTLGALGDGGPADVSAWATAHDIGRAVVMAPGDWGVLDDLVIDLDVIFQPGARLVGTGAPLVEFKQDIQAGPARIFVDVTANLTYAKCAKAFYEWWGAVGGRNPTNAVDLPDSTAAINAAWNCGHNHPTGHAFSYRHTGTLYGRIDKVCYGPDPTEPECEMWLDDPSGLLNHIVIGKLDGSPLYSPTIGNMVRARVQTASAGACVSLERNVIQPKVYGRDYNDFANKKTWIGLYVGPKCQDIHDRRTESVGNQSAGFHCSISLLADKVIGIYFECGYIRDSTTGINLYGFIEGVFSDQKLLLFNNTTNITAACASPGDMNVVKVLGGDNDTGGLGYFFDKVGSVSIRQWLSNLTTGLGIFQDCSGLDLQFTHAYAQSDATEGLVFAGSVGDVRISNIAGGVFAVRTRASPTTGFGCSLVFHIGKAFNDVYCVIENALPQGTGATNIFTFVGWRVGGAAALASAPLEPTTDIIQQRAY